MTTNAERFFALFEGNATCHGTHQDEKKNASKGKMEIKHGARTLRRGATVEDWDEHLRGERPLGIAPILSDGNCYFGAIDVDDYMMDHLDMQDILNRHKLPLIQIRSKSGGAHLVLFVCEPVAASEMKATLTGIAARIGQSGREIFPMQNSVHETEDGTQSVTWINMPYFGGDETPRYAYSDKGMQMSIAQFLNTAEERRLTRAEFEELNFDEKQTERERSPRKDREDDVMDGAPPCLQHLAEAGFPEGTRNNGLLMLGVFAKKKFPATWQDVLDDMNRKFVSPPLPSEEVAQVKKQLEKKDYHYKCSDQPIMSHCNSVVCRSRKFGVGERSQMPAFGGMIKYDSDPPIYYMTVDDSPEPLTLTPSQLMNFRSFKEQCFVQLNVVITNMNGRQWDSFLQHHTERMQIIEPPEEVNPVGRLKELMNEFLTDRYAAKKRDEILSGKPWFDEDQGVYMFRLRDLMDHLQSVKFNELNRAQIVRAMTKEYVVTRKIIGMKGTTVSTYLIEEKYVERQTEPLDTVEIEDAPV